MVRRIGDGNHNWNLRKEAAEGAFSEPGQRAALATDYGFCAYGDAPEGIGGGTPWFYWFETKEAMLATLGDHALFLNPPRADLDIVAIDGAIKSITATDGDLEAMRSELNKHLKGASQFTWIGSFKELCESEHPKAAEIRSEFRTENDKPSDSSPIQLYEADSFVEFIASYGV
jgi:hypothetical protein